MVDRLVIGVSGASGAIYAIRLLEFLKAQGQVETHLVLTTAAKQTVVQETNWTVKDVEALATVVHGNNDIGASIASGSFATRAMVIVPCSMKTLSAVANSYGSDLVSRAADVTLKEGRPLVLVARETPLHLGHLRLMVQATEAGAIIYPPVPAFYNRPRDLNDMINHTVGRILARVGLGNELFKEWVGLQQAMKDQSRQ